MWNFEPICFALSVLSSVHQASQKDLNAFAKRIGGPRGFLKCPLKTIHLSVSLDGLKSRNFKPMNWELLWIQVFDIYPDCSSIKSLSHFKASGATEKSAAAVSSLFSSTMWPALKYIEEVLKLCLKATCYKDASTGTQVWSLFMQKIVGGGGGELLLHKKKMRGCVITNKEKDSPMGIMEASYLYSRLI